MYSIHNEGKSVVAERFIRTLKTKIYKYMTSISKNVYIDKLDDIVNKYNNTYHSTIKMKPVDVKSNTYINSSKEINDKDIKFKIGDIVRVTKYKNISAKDYVHGHMLLVILKAKKLLERFTKKNWRKTNQKEFRVGKVIKRKRDILYIKWKGDNSSFNSWIDKKDLV